MWRGKAPHPVEVAVEDDQVDRAVLEVRGRDDPGVLGDGDVVRGQRRDFNLVDGEDDGVGGALHGAEEVFGGDGHGATADLDDGAHPHAADEAEEEELLVVCRSVLPR